MKPTWFLWLKAIMRFWVNTANQSSAHGPIDFASILISFGKIHIGSMGMLKIGPFFYPTYHTPSISLLKFLGLGPIP